MTSRILWESGLFDDRNYVFGWILKAGWWYYCCTERENPFWYPDNRGIPVPGYSNQSHVVQLKRKDS